MSFKDCMRYVTADLSLKIAFPDWMMNFTRRLRRVKLSFKELHVSQFDEHIYWWLNVFVPRAT